MSTYKLNHVGYGVVYLADPHDALAWFNKRAGVGVIEITTDEGAVSHFADVKSRNLRGKTPMERHIKAAIGPVIQTNVLLTAEERGRLSDIGNGSIASGIRKLLADL